MLHYLTVAAIALLYGASCYTAYRAGQHDSLQHPDRAGHAQRQNSREVAQRSSSSSITLHAEHDDDGPYIVVAIPWHTLCASGLKLPQLQADDCAEAKASKNADVSYILPTDDDSDDATGTVDQNIAARFGPAHPQRSLHRYLLPAMRPTARSATVFTSLVKGN